MWQLIGLLLLVALVACYWYTRGVRCPVQCDLTNRVAIVTGGTRGIGKETAISLAKNHCRVVIASSRYSEQALQDIKLRSGNDDVVFLQLNLASKQSIEKFVVAFNAKYQRLDILVNNAGLVSTDDQNVLTEDGYEIHFGVNFLGHYYLTHLLWGMLEKSDRMRVANLSSIGHNDVKQFDLKHLEKKPEGHAARIYGYCFSKLLMIYMTKLFAKRAEDIAGARVTSVDPGLVRTEITNGLGIYTRLINSVRWLVFVDA